MSYRIFMTFVGATFLACTNGNLDQTDVPDPNPPSHPCDAVQCGPGFHCEEVVEDVGQCLADSCDTLLCSTGQTCATTEEGGGLCTATSCDALLCSDGAVCKETAIGFGCVNQTCAEIDCTQGESCVLNSAGVPECVADTCEALTCAAGQTCVQSEGSAACVNNNCGTLVCESGQVCQSTGTGGATCTNLTCEQISCPNYQSCTFASSGGAVCTDNDCATLSCSATEECQTEQTGAICVDISCGSDLDCDEAEYCNGSICVADGCVAETRSCGGLDVLVCPSNGSSASSVFTCTAATGFTATCTDDGFGDAYCECRDDWDCPTDTACESGICQGTGSAPTCFLAPEPFSNVLPTQEIVWGGTLANQNATGSPFEPSVQVVMTPVVANLTDDNGDGLINEFDFPEIVFLSYCSNDFTSNGVLRAIHGGGDNKGEDFFAVCGGTRWFEGDALPATCTCSDANIDSTAGLAVGDLDGDGNPEIVAIRESDGIMIYDRTGNLLSNNNASTFSGSNPAPTIANIDQDGFAEIIVGRSVFTLEYDGANNILVKDQFVGTLGNGINSGQGPVSCVADITGDDRMEIIGGSTAYTFPRGPAGAEDPSDCTGSETDPEEVAFCNSELLTLWDAETVNGVSAIREGFCAVADVLGSNPAIDPSPTNPLDGVPEIVTVADGYLQIFDSQTGTMHRNITVDAGEDGGAPNIDDFDGDGFPEIGSAFRLDYHVVDLQSASANCPAWPDRLVDGAAPPAGNADRALNGISCTTDADCGGTNEAVCNQELGECVCLHNGWYRQTEDNSSRVTGSSVFDFNGDRAVEVVYNDECWFRIYDGLTGDVLFKEPSESRTRIEYPVVSDVDNDGNAEIIFATSTESGFCSERNNSDGEGGLWRDHYNTGIEVWGDAGDFWVSARRIWNQHAYHVTNVQENASIPTHEPANWTEWQGRSYNTYRSQPKSFGVAPDLVISDIKVSASGSGCGTLTNNGDILILLTNNGDVRVGPGVVLGIEGDFGSGFVPLTDGAENLEVTVNKSLEPGAQATFTVSYDSTDDGQPTFPTDIRVTADSDDAERECNESNNVTTVNVNVQNQSPDLRMTIDNVDTGTCPDATVTVTAFNDGTADASSVLVYFYAGDPEQGGQLLAQGTIASISASSSTSDSFSVPLPPGLNVTVFAVIDPSDAITECQEGNNEASTTGTTYQCAPVEL